MAPFLFAGAVVATVRHQKGKELRGSMSQVRCFWKRAFEWFGIFFGRPEVIFLKCVYFEILEYFWCINGFRLYRYTIGSTVISIIHINDHKRIDAPWCTMCIYLLRLTIFRCSRFFSHRSQGNLDAIHLHDAPIVKASGKIFADRKPSEKDEDVLRSWIFILKSFKVHNSRNAWPNRYVRGFSIVGL